jgi:hypothetical protein
VYDLRVGGGREKVIHRAALVGFQMGKSDPTQFLERDNRPHRVRYFSVHMAKAGMKEERFVAVDQKLIERETRPHRYERGNPINLIGDFVDSRFHDRSSQRAGIVWYGTIMKPLPARYGAALRRKTSRVEVTRVGTACRLHAAFVSDSESEPPSRFPFSRIS